MNFSRSAGLPILLFALMINSGQVCADVWQQTMSASISTEFVTNPAMSPAYSGEGVSRTILEPGYSLEGKFGENELKTGLSLQMARSSDTALSPDRNSPSVFLEWMRQYSTGEFGVSSKYTETSTRNAAIDAAAQIPATSTTASRTLSGRWSIQFSDRSTLLLSDTYESVFYKGTGTSGIYTDYASNASSMTFSYVWSEQITPFLQLMHTDYEPTVSNGHSSFTDTILTGLNWRSSEALEGSVQIGSTIIKDEAASTQGGMTVRYREQRSAYSIAANRQISPGGLGGFVTTDQANGSWSYELNERSSTGLNMSWQKNHFITDVISQTAGAWLQYDLDAFWRLRTYYQHNLIKAEGFENAISNILGFTISYVHTDF